jgi:hypothetical protein
VLALVALWLAPGVVVGDGFTFPVPAGYEDAKDFLAKKKVSALVGVISKDVDIYGFRPSIFVGPKVTPTADMGNPQECSREAAQMAASVNGKVKSWSLVDGPRGLTCQMFIVVAERSGVMTILKGSKGSWIMTCNFATNDLLTPKPCQHVLARFKFK